MRNIDEEDRVQGQVSCLQLLAPKLMESRQIPVFRPSDHLAARPRGHSRLAIWSQMNKRNRMATRGRWGHPWKGWENAAGVAIRRWTIAVAVAVSCHMIHVAEKYTSCVGLERDNLRYRFALFNWYFGSCWSKTKGQYRDLISRSMPLSLIDLPSYESSPLGCFFF